MTCKTCDEWSEFQDVPEHGRCGLTRQTTAHYHTCSAKQFSTVDWSNDDLFYTYTWADETSEFDDHPTKRWSGGLECYTRKYKARVPVAFKDCPVLIDKFIILMEDYPEAEGFWVD